MARTSHLIAAIACYLATAPGLRTQPVKPATNHEFECYAQSAEARMSARKGFLVVDNDPVLMQRVERGLKIETVPGNGPNPHKIAGAMVYDWIGVVFIPGARCERTVRMLQDYDHRATYFPEIIASSKLLCRSGDNRFGFTMRLKEPAVIDSENDVQWERVDPRRWRCRSYSTKVQEIGKQHGYLLRINSYWRFFENDRGTFVEGETVTLSGEFGSVMRTLGSLAGINPEKSLKKTLLSIRESLEKPGLEFAAPTNAPACDLPSAAVECVRQAEKPPEMRPRAGLPPLSVANGK